ncbi:MAG: DUF11 domain-containing protein, partial [Myxococcales bacterium]|nr:DUF11 domain-containing protein [Myxococcales bacterium]
LSFDIVAPVLDLRMRWEFDPVTKKSRSNGDVPNPGDIVRYIVTAKNIGNSPATNLSFMDRIPDGTSYEPSTLSVNSISQEPVDATSIELMLGSLGVNSTVTIMFSVRISSQLSDITVVKNSGVFRADDIEDAESDDPDTIEPGDETAFVVTLP